MWLKQLQKSKQKITHVPLLEHSPCVCSSVGYAKGQSEAQGYI